MIMITTIIILIIIIIIIASLFQCLRDVAPVDDRRLYDPYDLINTI